MTAQVAGQLAALEGLRDEFPALRAAPDVAYLDSATTTPRPREVIEAVTTALSHGVGSAARGSHPWASRASADIARVRTLVASFLGAGSAEEIVFTAGATAAMNIVALCWGAANLRDGDEVLYCPRDHQSTIRPWLSLRELLARFGVRIRLVPFPITATGEADPEAVLSAVGPHTRLIVVTHLHGLYGARTTLEELRGRLDPAVLLCFDCSQSAGRVPLDVDELRADFAVLSGHKMFGVPGIGVLYCARRTHELLQPILPGGTGAGVDAARMPALLEGGTPDVPGVLALGAAVDFIDRVGIGRIAAHNEALTHRIVDGLGSVRGIELLAGVAHASCGVGYGIVSLRVAGVSPADIGFVLAAHDVYVRAGGHCVGGGDADAVRLSVHAHTTNDEVDRAIAVIAGIARGGG